MTPALKAGGENVIAVRVNHEQYADSRWYAGSGINRNVFLSILDKVHVDMDGTFVTTPKITAELADVEVQSTLKNDGATATEITLVTRILAPGGEVAASQEETGSVPAGGQKEFRASLNVARPALWSPERPDVYSVRTQVKKEGAVIDEYTAPFGIRSFEFD